MLDNVTETARFVNVGLISLTAFFLFVRFNDLWGSVNLGGKLIFNGIVLTFLIGGYGSAEAYWQHAATGIRSPLLSLSCLLILVGLWISRRDPWIRDPSGRDTPRKKS